MYQTDCIEIITSLKVRDENDNYTRSDKLHKHFNVGYVLQ